MIVDTGRYSFRNPDGQVVEFSPGDWMRRWASVPVIAHDFLAGYDSQCFHSPGPGQAFGVTTLPEVLRNAAWLELVGAAPDATTAWDRIHRARSIIGVPWTFTESNCQDTVSAVVTGRPQSFQRDAVCGVCLVAVTAALLWRRGGWLGRCA